ncbi:MAG: trigger factor [Firmicutes bacterium]|nr:trigger factor [Bacillota bacterium]
MYKWEKIDNNKVLLEIEVPAAEVNEALDKAYRKTVHTFDVPGFRKGKVPRMVLERRFGPEIFYSDALEILVDPAYSKAVKECELEPIDRPEMELVQMEKNKPLIFKITVDVKPEVELGEYKGVTVKQAKGEITEEDVDYYLDSLLKQHGRLVVVEEGELQDEDTAIIDFKGSINGEPFEGGEAENHSLQIGSGTFIPGFEEQLIGARKGEQKEIKVTFPEDYTDQKLAGKEAVFNVEIKEVKRTQYPELNDDFVQELTEEFSTLEEFREDVENKLKENLYDREKMALESEIIEKVAEEAKVEVPEVLIERELDSMLGELDYYLRMQGLSLEQYGNIVEGGLEKLKEERKEEATKRAKANLALDAIIKKEAIEASPEEIDEKITEIIKGQDADFAEVKEQFKMQGRLDIMEHEIRYRKAIDMLVENANIVEVEEADLEEEKSAVEADTEGDDPDTAAIQGQKENKINLAPDIDK